MHGLLAQGYITSKDSPEKCYIPKEMKQQKKVETSKAGGWKSTIAPPPQGFWQATRFLSTQFCRHPTSYFPWHDPSFPNKRWMMARHILVLHNWRLCVLLYTFWGWA